MHCFIIVRWAYKFMLPLYHLLTREGEGILLTAGQSGSTGSSFGLHWTTLDGRDGSALLLLLTGFMLGRCLIASDSSESPDLSLDIF